MPGPSHLNKTTWSHSGHPTLPAHLARPSRPQHHVYSENTAAAHRLSGHQGAAETTAVSIHNKSSRAKYEYRAHKYSKYRRYKHRQSKLSIKHKRAIPDRTAQQTVKHHSDNFQYINVSIIIMMSDNDGPVRVEAEQQQLPDWAEASGTGRTSRTSRTSSRRGLVTCGSSGSMTEDKVHLRQVT